MSTVGPTSSASTDLAVLLEKYETDLKQVTSASEAQLLGLLLLRDRISKQVADGLGSAEDRLRLVGIDGKLRTWFRGKSFRSSELNEWRTSFGRADSWWWNLEGDDRDYLAGALGWTAAIFVAASIMLLIAYCKKLWDAGEGSGGVAILVEFGTALLAGLSIASLKRSVVDLSLENLHLRRLYRQAIAFGAAVCLLSFTYFGTREWAKRKALWYVRSAASSMYNGGVGGDIALRKGMTPHAVADRLSRAIALDPDSSVAHYQLGCLYEQEVQGEQAIQQYQQALSLDPNRGEAYSNLARALILYRNDYADAIKVIEESARAQPKGWALAALDRNYGWAMIRLGYPKDAAAQLANSLDVEKKQVGAHCLLGQALDKLGRPEANAEFNACVDANDARINNPKDWTDRPEPDWILEARKHVSK